MKQSHEKWFEENKRILEKAYLKHIEPWKQSGFSGPVERWSACRKPVAECVDKSGTFLDVGCANGYLIECLIKWLKEKNVEIIPFGLDISEKLIELAKQRVSEFENNFYTGNAFNWKPPLKFDYVRAELVYVPEELKKDFINKLMNDYLNDTGKLLVCEYRSANDMDNKVRINEELQNLGFNVESCCSGYWEEKELTRIAVILKKENQS
ncbi:MAG: class I SAM-dependent methyltransferase [Chlorobi bacterium]|nr:class I SAM-dependent methyltransferase [Chlorobiota bacterium]MCI0714695.1 class I SAM-dependent methyltransferase [Chlorobiota bacterium]